jgi:hypothetical protein
MRKMAQALLREVEESGKKLKVLQSPTDSSEGDPQTTTTENSEWFGIPLYIWVHRTDTYVTQGHRTRLDDDFDADRM